MAPRSTAFAASDAYYTGLIEALAFLCQNPAAGQVDEGSELGLRRWRYRQHRIFYRTGEDALLVVRVFHVAADAVRGLKD